MGGEEDSTRTPSLLLLPLCKLPATVPSPEPTHSPPRLRQPPPARPRDRRARRGRCTLPGPPHWPPSGRPCPRPPAPIKPSPSTPRRSTHPPQPIPTPLSSSLPRKRPITGSERRRVPGDFGHHWSCCWYEVEELSRRRRSATPPSSSASSPSRPRHRTVVPANAGEPRPGRGRRCIGAVRSRSIGRVPIRCVK
jgi:hypothetical protein